MVYNRPYEIDHSIRAYHGARIANYIIDYLSQVGLAIGVVLGITIINLLTNTEPIMVKLEQLNIFQEYFLGLIIMFVYYNFFEVLFGQTIGKFITGTVVVDCHGEKPYRDRILMRTLCRAIPFEAFSCLSERAIGWHDSISETYVVHKKEMEAQKRAFYKAQKEAEILENNPAENIG